MSKPKIFIGSSTEGLKLANAIHQNLRNFAEVTIWKQGIFKLSFPIITSLQNSLNNFDFAIFVFMPNDVSVIRDKEYSIVRDNVIFETGLFAGKLGLDRVFFLKPHNAPDLHLPSDLLGVVTGEYEADRTDNNLVAATGPFCEQVEQQITEIEAKADTANGFRSSVQNLEGHLPNEKSNTSEKGNSEQSSQLALLTTAIAEQVTVFGALNNELRVIKESLSTKYIGLFPDFVPYTLDMLKNAKTSIDIVCDFPCYSYFSDYEKHIEYKNIISEKLAKKVKVHLTCPNSNRRKELAMRQLGANETGWPLKEKIQTKLTEFINREELTTNYESITFDMLNDRIEEVNSHLLNDLFRNKSNQVDQEFSVFYWIVDDTQAVFSFPSFSDFNREQGFLTSDAKLIKALKATNLKTKVE